MAIQVNPTKAHLHVKGAYNFLYMIHAINYNLLCFRKSSDIPKVNDEKYFKYIDCDEESILNSDILTSTLVDESSPIVLEQEVVTDME